MGFSQNVANVAWEPISPELALVDPDLAARARAALPEPRPARPVPYSAAAPATGSPAPGHDRPYPLWARVTAALWLIVLGILIGGAAIPHAQDKPRVIPPNDDATTICTPEQAVTPPTTRPPSPYPIPPGG